ncbi:MAG: hypothetical protein MJ240_01820 [Kiritimatiellae bacterium]|nr:hypothetical protein [Kiritimatiellia bacterium]
MERDDRDLLITAAWLFARHGQYRRARVLCEALVEGDPKDGVPALAAAELMLADGDAQNALSTIRRTKCPESLAREGALLESRALAMLGRREESARRWKRYLATEKGEKRAWVVS